MKLNGRNLHLTILRRGPIRQSGREISSLRQLRPLCQSITNTLCTLASNIKNDSARDRGKFKKHVGRGELRVARSIPLSRNTETSSDATAKFNRLRHAASGKFAIEDPARAKSRHPRIRKRVPTFSPDYPKIRYISVLMFFSSIVSVSAVPRINSIRPPFSSGRLHPRQAIVLLACPPHFLFFLYPHGTRTSQYIRIACRGCRWYFLVFAVYFTVRFIRWITRARTRDINIFPWLFKFKTIARPSAAAARYIAQPIPVFSRGFNSKCDGRDVLFFNVLSSWVLSSLSSSASLMWYLFFFFCRSHSA